MYEPVYPPSSPEITFDKPTTISSVLICNGVPKSISIADTSKQDEKATTNVMDKKVKNCDLLKKKEKKKTKVDVDIGNRRERVFEKVSVTLF